MFSFVDQHLSQEYCEEFRDIIKKKNITTENGITLVNQQKLNEELPVIFFFVLNHYKIFDLFPNAISER